MTSPHPFPKWIVILLLILTPFIGLFDVVFGSVAYSTLFVGVPGEVEAAAEGIWAVPILLLTPFNVALLVLWLAAINMVRRRWWIARHLEQPQIESAPPGTELLADGSYLRLRAVNISPLLAGLIGAGVTGFLGTFAGAAATLMGGVGATAVLSAFGVALVFGAGLPWWFRRRHLDSGVKDLVIDPKGRCFAWDGGDPSGPNARDFDDITKVDVEKKVTSSRSSDGSTSTKTDYIVWLHGSRGPAESIYTFGNEPTKADAIAMWLRHVFGLRPA